MKIDELFRVGAHFGYSKSRNHPSTKRFIYGFKDRQAIINLESTATALARAIEFARGLGLAGQTLLFVGNKEEARGVVRSAAQAAGMPYVTSRWLGGTFTNWQNLKTRIERFNKLKAEKAAGTLTATSKKARARLEKEIARLERYLTGLAEMSKLPAAILVVDPREEAIAVAEAQKVGIPVIAIAGSDCDISRLNYPIVANDSNLASITALVNSLRDAYLDGVKNKPTLPEAEEVAS
jgi:small subunit ribosomal protein S2